MYNESINIIENAIKPKLKSLLLENKLLSHIKSSSSHFYQIIWN